MPKYHEDPSAELSHYKLRVAFFSVTLFHNNMSPTADKTALDVLKHVSGEYFQRVGGVSAAGVSELTEIRKQMTSLVTFDHLRYQIFTYCIENKIILYEIFKQFSSMKLKKLS